MELCLGTVQFGMDYGIRGKKKPELSEALAMMDYAVQNGISSIDTASAYGEAEDVVGTFLQRFQPVRDELLLTSKLLPNILEHVAETDYYKTIRDNLQNSLRRLHTDYLDGYYFHTPGYVFRDAAVDAMARLKREGYIRNVGVSAYEVTEVEEGISNPEVSLIQVPFSILDQRMEKSGVFAQAQKAGTMIHTRSAFIQGLIFMQPDEVPQYLRKATPILWKIEKLSGQYKLSIPELAIYFVKNHSSIDRLVFGVHNLEQLKENISIFNDGEKSDAVEKIAEQFQDLDADIVIPSLWRK